MPKYSGGSIKTALANLSSSRGAYVPKSLGKVLGGKISHPVYGTQRVSDALKKPSIDKKTLIEIFNKAKGVLRETQGTKTESEFLKQVAKQEKIDNLQAKIAAQIEQKNSAANKPVAAQNQGVKKSLPSVDKQANIDLARRKTEAAERWRGVVLGGKIGQVIEEQNKFRKTWGKSAELTVKSGDGGGVAAEGRGGGGLVGHAVKEEENDEKKSPNKGKSGQKSGNSASTDQKSGGHQPVKLQGSAGIDQLTHRQEVAKGENLPGGVYHVDGLNNKESVSQPETPPAPAPEDPDELNI